MLWTPGYLHVLDLAGAVSDGAGDKYADTDVISSGNEQHKGGGSMVAKRVASSAKPKVETKAEAETKATKMRAFMRRGHALVALESDVDSLFARRRYAEIHGVHSFALGEHAGDGDLFCMFYRVPEQDGGMVVTLTRRIAGVATGPGGARECADSVAFSVSCTSAGFRVTHSEAVPDAPRSRVLATELGGDNDGRLRHATWKLATALGSVDDAALPHKRLRLEFRDATHGHAGSLFFPRFAGHDDTAGTTATDRIARTGAEIDDTVDGDGQRASEAAILVKQPHGQQSSPPGRSSPVGGGGCDAESHKSRCSVTCFEVRPFALRPRVSAATSTTRGMCGLALADTGGISRRVSSHAFASASADVADIVASYCSATPIPVRANRLSSSTSLVSPAKFAGPA